MPRQDKTGPTGMGPMTGRKMGRCGEEAGSDMGMGRGRGCGRVMNGWFYSKYQSMPKDEKSELLKSEIEDLKQELQLVKKELEELEK